MKNEIIGEAVNEAKVNMDIGKGTERIPKNPTNRYDSLRIQPWPSMGNTYDFVRSPNKYSEQRIVNIFNSPVLMSYWASIIIRDCNNIATVLFCPPQSDCGPSFVASPDGKAIYQKNSPTCLKDPNTTKLSWYETCYN